MSVSGGGTRGVDPRVEKRLVEIAEGVAVEDDVLGIIHKIRRRWPSLVVQYVDVSRAEFSDAPFKIVEECPDGLRRPVMDVLELDERVIERLEAADTHRHNVLADLDAINKKATERGHRRFREERAALSEMVHGVLRSSKDTYTATNPVTGEDHTFRSIKHDDDKKAMQRAEGGL